MGCATDWSTDHIALVVEPDTVTLTVEDDGRHSIRSPTRNRIHAELGERSAGGLGNHLVRR